MLLVLGHVICHMATCKVGMGQQLHFASPQKLPLLSVKDLFMGSSLRMLVCFTSNIRQ